ncbi:MAG TPA: adenosylcobinamide-GDP ribazoletransferase [Geobacteraceae bacterium]|nr:adenosylcobinamide-GDP ribazoletransferase [Geobacteraceae bacterium]
MRLFLIALQFLTIIPLPFSVRCDERDLGRSMALFPLVGLTLGGLLVGADFILARFLPWQVARFLPWQVADLLLIVILTAVTGALHLDGLADVCDGLAARGGRERFLAVMKDPHTGAVGVAGLVLGLLLKYQALLHMPPEIRREALLFFPAVARFSQVQMTVGAKRARSDGLGSLFVGGAVTLQFVIAGLITLAAAFFLLEAKGVYCFLVGWFFTWGMKGWFHRRLGGITGDVLGCVSELNEIVCLLALVALFGGQNP